MLKASALIFGCLGFILIDSNLFFWEIFKKVWRYEVMLKSIIKNLVSVIGFTLFVFMTFGCNSDSKSNDDGSGANVNKDTVDTVTKVKTMTKQDSIQDGEFRLNFIRTDILKYIKGERLFEGMPMDMYEDLKKFSDKYFEYESKYKGLSPKIDKELTAYKKDVESLNKITFPRMRAEVISNLNNEMLDKGYLYKAKDKLKSHLVVTSSDFILEVKRTQFYKMYVEQSMFLKLRFRSLLLKAYDSDGGESYNYGATMDDKELLEF